MALFIKKQDNENQLFKIARDVPGIAKDASDDSFISLIVGLGNYGKEYEGTRHNAGFMAVDTFAKKHDFPEWQEKAKFKSYVCEDFIAGKKIILIKPNTLYNLSGEAVNAVKKFYKLNNRDITVIHDELDLPFNTVKEKIGGGTAGSNGLKNIISHIGADFRRIRIGIKNDHLEKMDPADFVLSKFSSTEKKQLPVVISKVIENL